MRELGDSSYHTREAAQRRLVEIGEAARPAVAAGLQDADPEIRARCRRIAQGLDIAAKESAKRRLESQLERFIADAGTDRPYDFPGWERFRGTIGNDSGSRQVFAELFRREVDLMAAASGPVAEAQQLVESKCRDLQLRMRGPARVREPIAWQSSVALAWLAGRSDVELRANEMSMLYAALVQSDVRRSLDNKEQGPAIRNVIGAWVSAENGGRDDGSVYQKLSLAINLEIKQGVPLAARLLRERRGTLQPATVAQCVQVFAKLGGKDQVPLLVSLLDDKTVCYTVRSNNDTLQTQVRDIALATLVRVTDQELRDYGFTRAPYRTSGTAPSPHTLGFSTSQESAREDAIKKWRAYRKRSGIK
jgi:hypothetical protein